MMRASSVPVLYTSRGTLNQTILAFSIDNNDESGASVPSMKIVSSGIVLKPSWRLADGGVESASPNEPAM